ncbi:MAG: bifunctional pyr operon transcriptional regulator/uracil phosphoribosyltransferase PyrR [Clostridia bacterium]|nr:bifunctional pyr operon transcriptional regulator/uracil phosphoribosyltransferase PyrR [Clostridia bacterium]
MRRKAVLYDENTLRRSIMRIAHEITEKNQEADTICLVGVKTRGIPIAKRLAECIYRIEGVHTPIGVLDITGFRDDIEDSKQHKRFELQLPFSVENKNVILVDDVIYTGRTVRAALDCLVYHGRPMTVQLAVLVDRGHRELPIRPDYVGKNIPTSKNELIKVSLTETDGKDCIELFE